MTKHEIRAAAIRMAVRKALREVGLKRIRTEPFFGMNQTKRMSLKKAA